MLLELGSLQDVMSWRVLELLGQVNLSGCLLLPALRSYHSLRFLLELIEVSVGSQQVDTCFKFIVLKTPLGFSRLHFILEELAFGR